MKSVSLYEVMLEIAQKGPDEARLKKLKCHTEAINRIRIRCYDSHILGCAASDFDQCLKEMCSLFDTFLKIPNNKKFMAHLSNYLCFPIEIVHPLILIWLQVWPWVRGTHHSKKCSV